MGCSIAQDRLLVGGEGYFLGFVVAYCTSGTLPLPKHHACSVDPFAPDSPIKAMGIEKFPPDMFFVLRVVQVSWGASRWMLHD